MKLYRITTRFLGKDLNQNAVLGYVVKEGEDGIYDHIEKKFKFGDWPSSVHMSCADIIADKGDTNSEYEGEFYDQKYGWEDLGEVSETDVAHLKRLGILQSSVLEEG
jgi:hypothetical protein